MSPHWLEFLEKFGPSSENLGRGLSDGDLAQLASKPNGLRRYDVLFRLFGPVAGSPWEPYHCPTLFAAIDRLNITPRKLPEVPIYQIEAPEGAFDWLATDTMIIVDLKGPQSIEFGARLIGEAAQPICTFDHWVMSPKQPMARVSIDSGDVVDAMFTLAQNVYQARQQLSPRVAPVWLCDRRRLGSRTSPSPGTFDNRYYIDDSLLPGPFTLTSNHIGRIVYVAPKLNSKPGGDLANYLADAHDANIDLFQLAVGDPNTWVQPQPMDAPFRINLKARGFSRSNLGGFGRLVPEPSEGSSYSSYGRGG